MAKHVTYIPDCPDCGSECTQMGGNSGKSHGIDYRLWACPQCGWESDHAEGWDAFDKLTERLTAHLRGDD